MEGFLKSGEDQWPSQALGNPVNEAAATEMVKQPCNPILSMNIQAARIPVMNIGAVMKCEQFSSFTRLQRVTAYVLRFIKLLKYRRNPGEQENHTGPLQVSELEDARDVWISCVQQDVFSKELEDLRKNVNSTLPYVRQFNLFISDSGILRCRGRLENSSLPYDANNPTLTWLIIKHFHVKIMHSGVRDTLTTLRENLDSSGKRGRKALHTKMHRMYKILR